MNGLARRLASIRYRLLAFNVLLVFLPAAGVLFLDTHERQLLADQERSMVEQGRVLAAALGDRGPLRAADAQRTLTLLGQRSGARIRVVDPHGRALGDSSRLGAPRTGRPRADPPRPASESWLYRGGALPFRAYRRLFGPPQPPHGSADVYAAGGPLLGSEVRAALVGRYGAATRISSGGQRSVTLYSAIPVFDDGRPVGAVLVSQSTFRILRALHRVRVDVLEVFLATLAAAVVLSLLVSTTIARPLRELRNQAEAVVDRRGRLHGRFQTPRRRDEIGDLARSLEVLRARLETHIRDIERFASDVSHEFKNPLASIRAAAELLPELDAPAERSRFVDAIAREVARMETLLSEVREISRLDAAAEVGADEDVDLRALLRGIVEAHRLRGGAPVQLLLPDAPVRVRTCPERLGRALVNLLDNAASFSPARRPVRIELARSDTRAQVRVLDRGCGIPEEHRERIFSRFFSYRPGREAGGEDAHAGLGLAIAQAIAEREGGSLVASNRSGGGACFELQLPVA